MQWWGSSPRRPRAGLGALVAVAVLMATLNATSLAGATPLTCQSATGYVRDVYGKALQGVLVTAASGCENSSSPTSRSGYYSLSIEPSLSGTSATPTKAGFATQQRLISLTPAPGGNDFT